MPEESQLLLVQPFHLGMLSVDKLSCPLHMSMSEISQNLICTTSTKGGKSAAFVSGGVKRGARRGFWRAIGEFSEELLGKTFVDAGLFSLRADPASNPLQNSSASAPQQALASSWLLPLATLGSCCVALSYCMGLATPASALTLSFCSPSLDSPSASRCLIPENCPVPAQITGNLHARSKLLSFVFS
jgi:hypothetical protein